MTNDNTASREARARRTLRRHGELLRKSHRASTGGAVYRGGVYQGQHIDDYGGFMIISERNVLLAGPRFDLTLDDLEAYVAGLGAAPARPRALPRPARQQPGGVTS